MRNYGPLWSYPGIIRNAVKNHRRKSSYLTLAILLTTFMLAGGVPGAWATGTLTASPGSLLFGDITVGQTQTKTISLKNSGTAAVSVSGDSVIGAGYRISGISFPQTLSVGQTVSFSVEFTPGQSGIVSAKLEILSDASNSTLILPLSGEGVVYENGYASVAPLNAPFGEVPVGTKDTEIITVMNAGKKSLLVDSVTTSAKGFSVSGITTPVSIAAGAETHFTVAFLPESAGSVSGSILVKSAGSDSSVTITVSGTGLASSRVLSVSPASLAFGNVDLGSSATRQISLKNTGNSNIAISGESITGTGPRRAWEER
jgi:Transmembrane protein 131-like N-terminal/Abnormal spindle-like microcephaly-assoc'd, ASPM-SPD-2-Hydin